MLTRSRIIFQNRAVQVSHGASAPVTRFYSSGRPQSQSPSPSSSSTTSSTLDSSSPSTSTSTPTEEPYNEATAYLAAKAARRAHRKSDPSSAAARHASVYTEIFPSLLRIFAWGSTAYFGLHLLWNVLDRDEQRLLMQSHTSSVEANIKAVGDKLDQASSISSNTGASINADPTQSKSHPQNKSGWWPFSSTKS
ncbi:hypothetical protein BCV70DRAFT_202102 [Testicularia cyperi]|uniref:Uncharacterized protein n=1 Tax=Testicularia cyperi TaxID=1882483 RepID=A0A317XLX8_9BASI|nr:hypothetical protein BCV70DRAFT_202102 [Testicularia cyperi]